MRKSILFVFLFLMFSASLLAQSAYVSTSAVIVGQTVRATWYGFSGNVDVAVYKGNSFWVHSVTNASGSGYQDMNTSGWELRGDYRVRVSIRNNSSIYAWSGYFSVSDPSASVSASVVTAGETLTAYWSGFGANVDVAVYKGSSFWVHSVTNVSGSGSYSLNTSGWEGRNDYRIKVSIRNNSSVYAWSSYFSVSSPYVYVNPTEVVAGDIVGVYWSGFSANVDVAVYKGNSFWVHSVTNVSGSGSYSLNTSGWEARSDYRVRVSLRYNSSVYVWSDYFSVSNPSVSVTPTEVMIGQTLTANWSGFSGRVDVAVYKGNSFWVHSVTNVSGSGSYSLNTSDWEARNDYRVRVSLRYNSSIYAWSSYFSVSSPSVSINTSAVEIGQTVIANWSGFNENVDVAVYKGNTFWVHSVTNVSGSGSYSLNTAGWELRGDYRVRVALRYNSSIYAWSSYFSVSNPSVSITPLNVAQGGSFTVSWNNFVNNVDVSVYKGNSFWVDSITNVSGTGSHVMDTAEWEIRSDYHIRVANRAHPNIYRFTPTVSVTQPAPPPTLLTPANGGSLTGPPYVFTWQAVSGAGMYHLKIATDAAFNNVVHYNNTIPGSETSYSTDYALANGNTYYWQMRTLDSSGTAWGPWGQYRSFVAHQGFNLTYPINGIEVTTQNIVFDWDDVPNVLYYRVYVDDDPSFGSPEIDTAEHPNVPQSEMNISQYEIAGNWLPPFTVFYWKVSAVFVGGGYQVSSVGQFEYNPELALLPTWVPVYRAYKESEVDHFYCTSSSHLQYAIDSQFVFEKVEGFLAADPYVPSNFDSDLKAVYRMSSSGGANINEKSHFYTTDDDARNAKIADDWYYEGIIGFTEDNDDFVPMYFLYKGGQNPPALNDYFYTTSEVEKNQAIARGYADMGTMCYLSLDGGGSTESSPGTQPTAGRGINPYNGNLAEYSKDIFSIPGGKMSLDLSFSYNSYSTKLTAPINPIGNGWNHNYNCYIYITPTRLFVYWTNGTIHIYNAAAPYNAITPGVYDKMQKISSTQYQITRKDQTTLTFNVLSGYSTVATLTKIQDRNGNYLNMVYGANDRLNYVTDRFGRRLQFYYYTDVGKKHLVHHVTDTAGNRTVYFSYDDHYNLASFQDAKGFTTQYGYDETRPYAHLLTSVIYPNGNVISCLYDSEQRVTNQTIGNTGQSLVVSGYSSPTARTVNDGGITSQYSYYQGVHAKIQQMTTPDVVASFQYSDSNNPTLPTSITDGRGYTTTMTYDSMGNVRTITKPGGVLHQYTYNIINDITRYRDPLNHDTYFGYTNGNLTSVQTPRGTTNYQYGPYGKIYNTTNPIGQQTTFTYDSYDNIASITRPLGLTTSYTYDAISRVATTTNPMNQTAVYQYDSNDNLISFTEFGDVTSYSYDQNDNLLSVSKNGQTTSLQYNDMGLVSKLTNSVQNITRLYYYPNGTLHYVEKPVGVITYSYNTDGTVATVNSQDTWTNYTYNGNRQVTNITDNNGNITFDYDSNNRVISVNSQYGFTGNVTYTYDDADNITSMTYGGRTVRYGYYADNLLHTVTDWNNRTTSFTYRNDGSLDYITYPNGIVCNHGYDAAGRLTSLSNAGSSATVNSYSYTLNQLGFHTSVNQTEPLEPFPMAHKNLNCTYDSANRILTAGNSTFTHSSNGCMTSRSEPQTSYSWDNLDRLLSVSGASNILYTYDALGNRRSRTENGTTTRYVLDLNSSMTNVLIETNASGAPINYYVYANGMLLSRIKPNGDTRYYHYDSRGSTIAMTNQSQQITHKYSYDPYGKVITLQEEDANPFRYIGGWGVMDEGNNLSYMRARYYDQNLGRFLSEDLEWSTSLYAYSNNNPIIFIDPSGRMSETVKQGIIDSTIESILKGKIGVKPLTSAVFIDYIGKRNPALARTLKLVKFFSTYTSIPGFIISAITTQIKEDLGLTKTSHEDEVVEHAQTLHDLINKWWKMTGRGPFNLAERAEWQKKQGRKK